MDFTLLFSAPWILGLYHTIVTGTTNIIPNVRTVNRRMVLARKSSTRKRYRFYASNRIVTQIYNTHIHTTILYRDYCTTTNTHAHCSHAFNTVSSTNTKSTQEINWCLTFRLPLEDVIFEHSGFEKSNSFNIGTTNVWKWHLSAKPPTSLSCAHTFRIYFFEIAFIHFFQVFYKPSA